MLQSGADKTDLTRAAFERDRLRIFNWYPWSAALNLTAYLAYWQQIVTTFRAVPNGRCKAIWNPNALYQHGTPDTLNPPWLAYPGDEFVDAIACDLYDQARLFGPRQSHLPPLPLPHPPPPLLHRPLPRRRPCHCPRLPPHHRCSGSQTFGRSCASRTGYSSTRPRPSQGGGGAAEEGRPEAAGGGLRGEGGAGGGGGGAAGEGERVGEREIALGVRLELS